MSATRTQIYLTEQQRSRIDEVVRSENVTLAEVIRRALDVYFSADADVAATLEATFGADPGAQAPDRGEWDRGESAR